MFEGTSMHDGIVTDSILYIVIIYDDRISTFEVLQEFTQSCIFACLHSESVLFENGNERLILDPLYPIETHFLSERVYTRGKPEVFEQHLDTRRTTRVGVRLRSERYRERHSVKNIKKSPVSSEDMIAQNSSSDALRSTT